MSSHYYACLVSWTWFLALVYVRWSPFYLSSTFYLVQVLGKAFEIVLKSTYNPVIVSVMLPWHGWNETLLLSAKHVLIALYYYLSESSLWDMCYYCTHLTNKETQSQRSKFLVQGNWARKRQNLDWNAGLANASKMPALHYHALLQWFSVWPLDQQLQHHLGTC